MANGQLETKVRTGEVRLSYPHLFEAHAMDGGEAKYSVSLIIPKNDKDTLLKIKKAIEAAVEQGVSSKWNGKKPANLKMPLRDGDTERPEDEAYAGAYFINTTCKTKPGVVLSTRVGTKFVEATPEDVYAGCYGIASVNFYPFNAKGNKGVACGLNNIMKTKDGENLGGRIDADTDFADVDIPEGEEALDMNDLLG
ncbi:MAG: DUF2815 family protein [Breznakia sp.]